MSLDPDPTLTGSARRFIDLAGLTALAVAHPTFEVLSGSPEFFVARNTTLMQAIALAATLVVLLPALLTCLESTTARVRPGAERLVHSVLVGALVGALVLPWLKRAAVPPDVTGPAALLAGFLVTLLHRRFHIVGMFVTALAPAVLAVPFLFFADRNVKNALVPLDEEFIGAEIEHAPPIVLIVFDEFPLNSLLDENHEIDAGRYPHFAALAGDSHLYRNASTVSSETIWAVPAIVTGSYPFTLGAVPTRRYYPNNLFTLLADRYEMTVFGRFIQLCPTSRCRYDLAAPRETISKLVADVGIVWLHIVLPDGLTARLPPIVGDWRGFVRARNRRPAESAFDPNDRDAEFGRFLDRIDGQREGRLYFLHSLLPHMPFRRQPSGRRYYAPDYQGTQINGRRLFEAAGATFTNVQYQRHLLQVGYVDTLMGRLTDRLKETGIYDDALIIVTADHGAAHHAGQPRRVPVEEVFNDIALVPLLVKLPDQREGIVSDETVQVIDILPTIADVLSIDLPFKVDGRSLLDSSDRGHGRLFAYRTLTRIRLGYVTPEQTASRASVASKIARLGSRTNARLYGVGRAAWLLGRKVSESGLAVESTESVETRVTDVEVSRSAGDGIPLYMRGTIRTIPDRPVALAIVVDDRIVATTETFDDQGGWRFASAVPEDAFQERVDEPRVFLVDLDDETPRLFRVH